MKRILIPGILAAVLIMAFGFAMFPVDLAISSNVATKAAHDDLKDRACAVAEAAAAAAPGNNATPIAECP